MPRHAFRKPSLSRTQIRVLLGALAVHFLVSLFTPSRPHFVGTWHLVLTLAIVAAALAALVGWAWARFGVQAKPQTRWKAAFWLLWLALAFSLAPAALMHLSQANYLPLVRLMSGLVMPMVIVYVLLHLTRMAPEPISAAASRSSDA